MPSNFVKKAASVCGIDKAEVEKKWNDAKKIVKDQYPNLTEEDSKFWAIVVGVTKKMLGKECSAKLDSKKESSKASELLDHLDEFLNELKIKRVVRGGKIVRKKQCPPGMKFQGGRCVRIKPAEKRARRKAAKRTARKVRAKAKQIARKRARSMRRRKSIR